MLLLKKQKVTLVTLPPSQCYYCNQCYLCLVRTCYVVLVTQCVSYLRTP